MERDINMAKYCVDSEGDVVLTVEMPRANLDYGEFAEAIKVLCHYADDTYREMISIARNPNASSRYQSRRVVIRLG